MTKICLVSLLALMPSVGWSADLAQVAATCKATRKAELARLQTELAELKADYKRGQRGQIDPKAGGIVLTSTAKFPSREARQDWLVKQAGKIADTQRAINTLPAAVLPVLDLPFEVGQVGRIERRPSLLNILGTRETYMSVVDAPLDTRHTEHYYLLRGIDTSTWHNALPDELPPVYEVVDEIAHEKYGRVAVLQPFDVGRLKPFLAK